MKKLLENWSRFLNEVNQADAEAAVGDLNLSPEEMKAVLGMLQGKKVQLEEGVMDSISGLVKRFGKKAIMAALVTSITAGAVAPSKAYASDVDVGSSASAQVVDAKAEKDAAAALGLLSDYVDKKIEQGADRVDTSLEYAPLMKALAKAKDGDMSAYDSLNNKDKATFDTLLTKVKGYNADLYDAYLSIGMGTTVR